MLHASVQVAKDKSGRPERNTNSFFDDDLAEVLGVDTEATVVQLKAAYRSPDTAGETKLPYMSI